MKKKTRLTLASLAIVGVLVAGGSLAYFTDTDTKTNVVTLGKVDGELDEDSKDGTEKDDDSGYEYEDVTPGEKLDKQPDVTLATDSQPAYVRVKVEVVNAADANVELDQAHLNEILVGLTGTPDDWVFVDGTAGDATGYFYYQNILAAGATTSKVFTTVNIPTTWTNAQAEAKFEIKLTAELVQSENLTDVLEVVNGKIVGWTGVDIQPAN